MLCDIKLWTGSLDSRLQTILFVIPLHFLTVSVLRSYSRTYQNLDVKLPNFVMESGHNIRRKRAVGFTGSIRESQNKMVRRTMLEAQVTENHA